MARCSLNLNLYVLACRDLGLSQTVDQYSGRMPPPEPWTPGATRGGYGLWTGGCGLWTGGCGLWTGGCGLWMGGCGLWMGGCGLWTLGDAVYGRGDAVYGRGDAVYGSSKLPILQAVADAGGSYIPDLTFM